VTGLGKTPSRGLRFQSLQSNHSPRLMNDGHRYPVVKSHCLMLSGERTSIGLFKLVEPA
jgi:hypothetical protein